MMSLGGAFWLQPEFFTLLMFPNIAENQEAMKVGVLLRKNMGAGSVFIGIILFSAQSSSKTTAQRLLFSCAFGFLLLFLSLLHLRVSEQAEIPMFILVFFSTLSVLSVYVASRRFQE